MSFKDIELSILDSILNIPEESFIIASPDAIILEINSTGLEWLGKKKEKVLNKDLYSFFPDDIAKQ